MLVMYCNKCFKPKTIENSNKFYISKCSHIFCQLCLPTGPCHACKAPYKARTIDANMPKAMEIYFEPPEKAFRRFQKILQFQTSQYALYAHYWLNVMPLQIQEDLKKFNGMRRISAHLNEKLAHETKRIEKLKLYLAYKKRCSQELNQMRQRPVRGRSSTVSSNSRYNNLVNRLKTPTISSLSEVTLSSANCSNCTDLSKQGGSFSKRARNDFRI
ncbi:RING finger protein narya-like [Anastrepha ludens]|uniref:RING finger protein narya-like n=1 Tax=Anastrepha ludens TaxID=28586 RepID=UPI0023B1871B|nr:RING finger protein narya-like [Anastrepha ludens]